jgi:hypothetical protein
MPLDQPSMTLPLFRIVKEFVSKSFLNILQIGKRKRKEYTFS